MKRLFYTFFFSSLLIWGACDQSPPPRTEADTPVRPVRYIVLKAEGKDRSQTFSGTAEAEKESILSFKVSGTVKTIPVKVGDRVKADTLLAELDKTDLMVDLESARAAAPPWKSGFSGLTSQSYIPWPQIRKSS